MTTYTNLRIQNELNQNSQSQSGPVKKAAKKPRRIIRDIIFFICTKILFLLGLILAFFFIFLLWPKIILTLSWIILIFSIGTLIIPIILREYMAYKQGKSSSTIFWQHVGLETAEIIIIMALVLIVAGISSYYVIILLSHIINTPNPNFNNYIGLFGGIATAIIIGVLMGYGIRFILKKIKSAIFRAGK